MCESTHCAQKLLATLARHCRLSLSRRTLESVEVTTGRHARLRGETEMGEAWIIDAVRTPRGKGRKDVGALVQTHPQELMATTLRALTLASRFPSAVSSKL